jgi:hypothetical protein
MPEEKPVCPKCESSELIVLLANEKHCNQCGHSFDLVKDPIAQRTAQTREARSAKTGWQPHKHGQDG